LPIDPGALRYFIRRFQNTTRHWRRPNAGILANNAGIARKIWASEKVLLTNITATRHAASPITRCEAFHIENTQRHLQRSSSLSPFARFKMMTKPLIYCAVAITMALLFGVAYAQAFHPTHNGSLRAAMDAISRSIAEHPAEMIPP
jgi:hypothetical protein